MIKTPDPGIDTLIAEVTERASGVLELSGTAFAVGAMLVIALRSCLRLELRWDTFSYHLPFAAMFAHMRIPFELSPYVQTLHQGYPSLTESVQGILWRLTGTVHATGVVNYLAFGLFLYFAWRHLGARLWLLTLLCLTAPLVLIHASCSYTDLFAGAFLAIGVTGFLAMLLFDRWEDKPLLLWTLGGLVVAMCSKYTATAIGALMFAILLLTYIVRWRRKQGKGELRWVVLAMMIASLPYAKNMMLYHNPVWPLEVTALKNYLPYELDMTKERENNSPPPLAKSGHISLFVHSLFEIDHPISYPNRERWIIDQGNSYIAYRSGGFWVVAVVTGAIAAVILGFLSSRRHGWIVTGTILGLWCFVSVLPESHYLRYFLFLPLTVSALIAILLPGVRKSYPMTALTILCIVLCEFVWITKVNHVYYRVERVGYKEAAEAYGVKPYWNVMQPGETYCAVGFAPAGFLLTGPTMHEFHIIDRDDAAACPPGMKMLKR